MWRSYQFVVLLAFLLVLGAMAPVSRKPIRIDAGLISGVTDSSGTTTYLGIPFAAPPVGSLRWRPPQPVAPWDGVRVADHVGASCMQNEVGSRLPWTEEFMTQGVISEDCLFLNVWTAAKSPREKQAVMVYIYGGGFSEGSGAVAVYSGSELATKGVVVATLRGPVKSTNRESPSTCGPKLRSRGAERSIPTSSITRFHGRRIPNLARSTVPKFPTYSKHLSCWIVLGNLQTSSCRSLCRRTGPISPNSAIPMERGFPSGPPTIRPLT